MNAISWLSHISLKLQSYKCIFILITTVVIGKNPDLNPSLRNMNKQYFVEIIFFLNFATKKAKDVTTN